MEFYQMIKEIRQNHIESYSIQAYADILTIKMPFDQSTCKALN